MNVKDKIVREMNAHIATKEANLKDMQHLVRTNPNTARRKGISQRTLACLDAELTAYIHAKEHVLSVLGGEA